MDLERTSFSQAIFQLMDEDRSGQIDFREFVIALWNYCTLSKATLAMFAFDLYDHDRSGVLDATEIRKMLKDVYGPALKESLPAAQIIIALEELGARHSEHAGETPCEIEIEIEAFFEFSKTHPGLLYPAFQMQHDIQRCCRWPFVYKVHPETNLNTLSLLSRALLHSLSLSLSYMHIYAEAKSLGQSSGVATPNSVSISPTASMSRSTIF